MKRFEVGDKLKGKGSNQFCTVIQADETEFKVRYAYGSIAIFQQKSRGILFEYIRSNTTKEIKNEDKKMKKPETKLEQNACKQAVKESIKQATDKKALKYQQEIDMFVSYEQEARRNKLLADEQKELLGLTDAQIKELL